MPRPGCLRQIPVLLRYAPDDCPVVRVQIKITLPEARFRLRAVKLYDVIFLPYSQKMLPADHPVPAALRFRARARRAAGFLRHHAETLPGAGDLRYVEIVYLLFNHLYDLQ